MTLIEHYRNSFFSIISNENKVLWCDPWISHAHSGLWAPAKLSIVDFLKKYTLPDIVYISHIHDDHFDLELLKLLNEKKDFKIIIPKGHASYETMFRRLQNIGISSSNINKLNL